MGRVGSNRAGAKISRLGPGIDSRLGVLLSNGAGRRRCDGRAGFTADRRLSQLYFVAADQPGGMADDDDENIRSPIRTEEVSSISKGNGPSSFADPGIRRGIGDDDSGRF
jgi:hypothetical protein